MKGRTTCTDHNWQIIIFEANAEQWTQFLANLVPHSATYYIVSVNVPCSWNWKSTEKNRNEKERKINDPNLWIALIDGRGKRVASLMLWSMAPSRFTLAIGLLPAASSGGRMDYTDNCISWYRRYPDGKQLIIGILHLASFSLQHHLPTYYAREYFNRCRR